MAIKINLIIAVAVGIVLMLLIAPLLAKATAENTVVRTNINPVNDFLDKEITDRQGLENLVENSKQQAQKGIESKQLIGDLSIVESELEGKASQLNAINANSLEAEGFNERNKEENRYYNDFELDYSSAHLAEHKKDIDLIVDASSVLLAKLTDGLKELGIDCKTVKGNKEIDPEYIIEVKKEQHKDTIYNKHICEELRNRYSCSDTLHLTCKKKGMEWGEWQDKEIHIPAADLFSFGKPIFWIDHTGKRCFEYKLTVGKTNFLGFDIPADAEKVLWMREFLATKHAGSTIENISDQMSSSWYGGIFSIDGWRYGGRVVGYKDHAWQTYLVKYQYRDGKPICVEWAEEWKEGCSLQ